MLSGLSKGYQDKLKAIYNHFGEDAQRSKLLEELEEAEHEISEFAAKYLYPVNITYPNINRDKLIEEITDCYVVAAQVDKVKFIESLLECICEGRMEDGYKIINYIKGWKEKEVLKVAKEKIDRTIKRYSITV